MSLGRSPRCRSISRSGGLPTRLQELLYSLHTVFTGRRMKRIERHGFERVDVDGQPAFFPQVIPGVLVGGQDVPSVDVDDLRQPFDEAQRISGAVTMIVLFIGDQTRIAPDRLAIAAPPAAAWSHRARDHTPRPCL